MQKTATQQIYDLIDCAYQRVQSRIETDPLLLSDFKYYLARTPLTSAFREELKDRATPSLKFLFDRKDADDAFLLFHAFRDPFAKILTVYNARLDYLKDPQKPLPVPFMDRTLARTCFYLQDMPGTFREILNIGNDDENNLAQLLNDIEARIVPEIRSLVPFSLCETGNSAENFGREYRQLQDEFPANTSGTEALAPRGRPPAYKPDLSPP